MRKISSESSTNPPAFLLIPFSIGSSFLWPGNGLPASSFCRGVLGIPTPWPRPSSPPSMCTEAAAWGQPAYLKAAQVGKAPRRMPRDWLRPKKFGGNVSYAQLALYEEISARLWLACSPFSTPAGQSVGLFNIHELKSMRGSSLVMHVLLLCFIFCGVRESQCVTETKQQTPTSLVRCT